MIKVYPHNTFFYDKSVSVLHFYHTCYSFGGAKGAWVGFSSFKYGNIEVTKVMLPRESCEWAAASGRNLACSSILKSVTRNTADMK